MTGRNVLLWNSRGIVDVQAYNGGLPGIIEGSRGPIPEDVEDTVELQRKTEQTWDKSRRLYSARPRDSLESIREEQLSRLRAVIESAFATVPFYRSKLKSVGYSPGNLRTFEDMAFLPILTRAELAAVPAEELLSGKANSGNLYSTSTSGSTGKTFTVYYDDHETITQSMEYYRYFSESLTPAGLDDSRWLYNVHMSRGWISSVNGRYRTFTLNEILDVEDVKKHLNYLGPQVLCTPPSFLKKLSDIGREIRDFGIRVIVTNSEQGTQEERDEFSRLFGVPVLDEYSSAEIGIIAVQCLHKKYHVNEDGVYVEIVQADREQEAGFGRTIVTDLRNYVMPMIRYDQGDIASWGTAGRCGCGQNFRVLSQIHGRADECFVTPDGREIASGSLLNAVDVIFCTPATAVDEFRLAQHGPSAVTLYYVLKRGFSVIADSDISEFEGKLRHLFDTPLDITYRKLTEMPPSKSYKRKKIAKLF